MFTKSGQVEASHPEPNKPNKAIRGLGDQSVASRKHNTQRSMQIWTSLVAAFLGLAAIASAKDEDKCHRHRHHHHHSSSSSSDADVHVHLKPDVGFYAFNFGDSQTPVWTNFFFKSRNVTAVTITDAYCEGDYFSFADNGHFLGNTYYGCSCPNNCAFYQPDPWNAMWDDFHCTGGAFLVPGCHNLTIFTENSVYNSGTAFIRLDTVCTFEGYLLPCCSLDNSCSKAIVN